VWEPSLGWLTRIARKPGFWLLLITLVLITLPHYEELIPHPSFLTQLTANLGLERHTFERILYLAPIVWAGFLLGRRGALAISLVALACMLPQAIFITDYPTDALFETSAVFILGNVLALTIHSLRKERTRRTQLAALNQTSSVISQSLQLSQVLKSSIDSVIDVTGADAAMVFLLDEEAGELAIVAHRGISPEFVRRSGNFRLGQDFNGRVAETGEPLYLEDVSKETTPAGMTLAAEWIRSQLIVPLKSKGRVLGTLWVAARSRRKLAPEEVELVTAIGNQIGVAIDNAHHYEQERRFVERLRVSEERYRELFENAHDAIWLHDLEQTIIAANRSFFRLTGYAPEELNDINASHVIAGGCLDRVKGVEEDMGKDEAGGYLSEVTLVKKDKSEASIQLSTSPVYRNGQLLGFQHIARDVTEEKRMKENLRFYLGQVTRAQEEERMRIARELHDETSQALVVLSRQLDELASTTKGLSKEKRVTLEDLRQQANSVMEGVRRLSQDLRPPTLDRLGLLPALEWLAANVSKGSGITIEVQAHGAGRRLSSDVELLLFRIAQEALNNVWRHSGATNAEVVVEFEERKARMTIHDNGKGFDLPDSVADLTRHGKLGLAGMQERARLLGGSAAVESTPGKGSTITIEAPYEPTEDRSAHL
jgi:PAS domain S-box-containing protein